MFRVFWLTLALSMLAGCNTMPQTPEQARAWQDVSRSLMDLGCAAGGGIPNAYGGCYQAPVVRCSTWNGGAECWRVR